MPSEECPRAPTNESQTKDGIMDLHMKRRTQTRTIPKVLVIVALIAASLLTAAPVQAEESSDYDISSVLPQGAGDRFAELRSTAGISSPIDSLIGSAINPDDFECNRNAEIDAWFDAIFGDIDPALFELFDSLFVLDWAADYTVLFDNDPSDTYIGTNGEYTKEQKKRHRKADRFWDAPTSDIQLHGMHGADIADDAKMIPLLEWGFEVSTAEAQEILGFVQEVIENEMPLGYDHPLFTFNAFAVPGFDFPGFGSIPDKIVMGDGLLNLQEDIGLGTNAPDLIHAHEFAHHVQFEIGAFDTDITDEAEATRRTELMADAFAAYNLAHSRGASFQTKRIVDMVTASFGAGDCGFDFPGHHGTPNQRAAAAQWGADLAQSTKPRGKIFSAQTMLELFEAELPSLVAPDAG